MKVDVIRKKKTSKKRGRARWETKEVVSKIKSAIWGRCRGICSRGNSPDALGSRGRSETMWGVDLFPGQALWGPG